ncbi:RNA 2',3'-cyclic phosphodiesterase [Labilibaculum sp. A4]|uniref:RNA 2',3'-cyclic phosphodiesterase n=1 Tax=Labilibaculum euxinus TaxID=2686357 RepID=UPI000F619592|nr:RNA 2',3'-cyclic phosphodiesterase [Labilibaculum euxinus]MDQ1771390.1 RNA 2',3'-cyclic phosphodiesterase [Labilibaculum euxinus]MWN77178.1 RNA 2',3'-cyclic phosphodiesterase [Labilibaculum euxinus]
MKTKRIFVAIKIDNTHQINELFRQVGVDLDEERIKWVDKNGLHITLLFLGETGMEEMAAIMDKLKMIGADFDVFRLNLKSLGAFPSIEHPRILWAGINSTSSLYELQMKILIQLKNEKVTDDYKYTPHLTIGRIKGGVENPERIKECLLKWKDWQDSELLITEFVLMESLLTQQGPVYKVLEIFSLKNQNV